MKKRYVKVTAAFMAVMMLSSTATVHAEDGIYTVKRDDNLSKIAKEVYGDSNEWRTIYEANKDTIKDANILYAGQQLILPQASYMEEIPTTAQDISATTEIPTMSETSATTEIPTISDFDKYGLVCNAELDKEYPYTTLTYKNKDIAIDGTVLFSNYRTFESDEEHEGIEGYEWRSVDVTFTYSDDNAWNYGTTSSPFTTDFYVITPKKQSGAGKTESDVGVLEDNDTYTVNFNGIDYTECLKEDHALVMEWNNRVYTCKIQFSFRVPIGYDGSIVGAISDGQYNDGDYIYEVADKNTLFFRLK